MHEIWCFCYDGITPEVHPTGLVDVGDVVVGQLSSNYLTENGRRIPIIGQIPINGVVKYLGIPDFHRTSGPIWVENILAPHSSWGYCLTPNKMPLSWTRNVIVPWNGDVPAPPAYMTVCIPKNARAAVLRVRDE